MVGINLLDVKTSFLTIVIITARHWQRNRHTDEGNAIESPEINQHKYIQLIFDKDAKVIQWNTDSLSNK